METQQGSGTGNASPAERDGRLARAIKTFERVIVVSLVVTMMLIVAISTIELGWMILKQLFTVPLFLIEANELLEVFGFFLLILIGVELLETIKAYLRDTVVHVEIVLEVALIALARKVIALDLAKYEALTVLAMAALITALAGAFFLERRARAGNLPG
jgi:uncharacterized membrane protein (DUF373 family)